MALDEVEIYEEMRTAVGRNENLQDAMKSENKSFKSNWFKAQLLLGNGPDSVKTALTKLEQLMEQTLEAKLAVKGKASSSNSSSLQQDAAVYWGNRRGNATGKDARYQHILSDVLTEAEHKKDFTHEGTGWFEKARGITPGVPYMASVVSAQVFDFQLRNAQQWKDVGVPAEHGEYTHRIQWFVLSESPDIAQPAQLMRDMAKFGPTAEAASAAWDATVDRLKATATYGLFHAKDDNDFRSPENFNNYLTGGGATVDFPLLAAFLTARRLKRASFDLQDYVSKKLFRKTYALLDIKEKAKVDTVTDPSKQQGMIHRAEVKG